MGGGLEGSTLASSSARLEYKREVTSDALAVSVGVGVGYFCVANSAWAKLMTTWARDLHMSAAAVGSDPSSIRNKSNGLV